MAIESRIEGDLSGQNTNSQSRIEQILNGEQITPRSRIEQLLQEYNPEDPGDYHKVECTKAQYDNMPSHSSSTIYVVTYPDSSVHFYLGDEEIEGEPVLITKTITENDTYNASDDNADGYSSVTVNVPSVTPTLIEKSITENGIYDAEDEGADGYSIVEVDVEGSSYTFKGHVALSFPTGGDGGAYIPETKLGLDTSKDFEIIVCVWIGANYTLPSSTIFELIGTGSYDVRRKYPQLEFDNRGIWYAASSNDGASWDQSGTISASDVSSFLIQGSYNYLKLKYSVTEAKLSVWHSSDGETFTKKGEISTPNGISNTTSYPMAFGNTALLRDDRAPFSDDFYIAFDKCKIISEETVIYGGKLVEETTLITKSITSNDTYNASDDNADGYSSVTVNVPINMEIVPYGTLYADSYIKRGTGEVGSYSGDTATDFIEIDPDNYYYMFGGKLQPSQGQRWDPTCNAYYDSNKQYISGFSLSLSQGSMDPSTVTSNFLEFPSTAKYIRISQATEAFSDFKTFILKIRKSYVNPNA